MLKYHNELIDPEDQERNKKMLKDQEKKRKKKAQQLEERRKEMQKVQSRLPGVQFLRSTKQYSVNIKVDNFDLEIGGKTILEQAQLILTQGKKYGIIGKNGIGKTTLLYAIARKEIEGMNVDPQILMVEQEIKGSQKTPL